MFSFRGIYTDEPDSFFSTKDNGITINNSGAFEGLRISTGYR